ncbi:hypothetical protein ACFWDA_24480 [Rhodococcus zopfii]|uniref:hypothetical protein n=1 Tax=Rhodococcus zopfii TaxID=43772 RepID=UPI003653EE7E
MAEAHVDQDMREHGTIRWFKGEGPMRNPQQYTGDCPHMGQGVVGWGPDEQHYELVECSDCGARSWTTTERQRGGATPWLVPGE